MSRHFSDDIPKVELHCHLEGLIDPQTLTRVVADGFSPPFDIEAFSSVYPINSMKKFLRWFEIVAPMEGDLERYKPFVSAYLEKLKNEKVFYLELMIGEAEIPTDRDIMLKKFIEFRKYVDRVGEGKIRVEFLGAFGRGRNVEKKKDLIERFILLAKEGLIVGVALAGLEKGFPVQPFRSLFEKMKEAGLKIEIHAGEWAGPESIKDALENGFPDRIGHGTTLFSDPKLVDLFVKKQIHIEMCPTSNLKTESIGRIEDHPLKKALELGLNFSINSDDPGAFETSPGAEYRLAAEIFGFSYNDLKKVTENAYNSRFGK